ncbi:hypothetical protein [Mycoplasma phocimorsus]|uniref:hypothetical protein n=1 Tax=Mycoplasma phocimorsus TaxID=3045839 RepID=UPI0024C0017F|nr:hypothetical protein [Mycoplasma phocimorsus]MDJ1648105.1 hypothetical protein [Mycoplasma phocimorsus]
MSKIWKLLMPLTIACLPLALVSAENEPKKELTEEEKKKLEEEKAAEEKKNNPEEYTKLFNSKGKDFLKSIFNDFVKKLDEKIIDGKKAYDNAEKEKDFEKIKDAASEILVFEKYKEYFTKKDDDEYVLKDEFINNPEKFGISLTFLKAITTAKKLTSAKIKFDGRDFVDIVTSQDNNYDKILNIGGKIDDEKEIVNPLTYKKVDEKIAKYFSALKSKFEKIFLPDEIPKVKLRLEIKHEKVEFVPIIDEKFDGDWDKFLKKIFQNEFIKFDLENNKVKDEEKEKEKEKPQPQPKPQPKPKPAPPDQPKPAPPAKPKPSDQERDFPKESSPQVPHDPQAEILKIPDLIPYFENIDSRNFLDANHFLQLIDPKKPIFFNPVNTRYSYSLNSITGSGNKISVEGTITDLLEADRGKKISRTFKTNVSLDEYRYKQIDLAIEKNKYFQEKMKEFYDALKVGEHLDYEKLTLPEQKSTLRKIIERGVLFLLNENESKMQFFLKEDYSVKQAFDHFIKYLVSLKIEGDELEANLNLLQALAAQNDRMFKLTIFENIYKNEDAVIKINRIYDKLNLEKEQVNEFNRNTFLSFKQLNRIMKSDIVDYTSWYDKYVRATAIALNNASKLWQLGKNFAKTDLEKDGDIFRNIQKEIKDINKAIKREQDTSLIIIFSVFIFLSLIMMLLGFIMISKNNKTRNKLIIILLTLGSFILAAGIVGLLLILI